MDATALDPRHVRILSFLPFSYRDAYLHVLLKKSIQQAMRHIINMQARRLKNYKRWGGTRPNAFYISPSLPSSLLPLRRLYAMGY